ncbi:hypothetical protein GN244_ATG07996 [Phytophthora infestans]|uniref:Uncharacterized protein n=1 Tax=Phytophthora infestans TaxID=4787 RepID=A0A833SWD9_PHYIN|nr:hypothetical protein GN244_ATG07996 [Phytophthora infestans]
MRLNVVSSPPPRPVWQLLLLQLGLASFAANLVLALFGPYRVFTGFSFALDLPEAAHLSKSQHQRPLSIAIFYLQQPWAGYGLVGRPAASSNCLRRRPSCTPSLRHLLSTALGLLVVLLIALRQPMGTPSRGAFLLQKR